MGKRPASMRRQNAQFSFDGKPFHKPQDKFGGSLLKGNPKKARPLDSKFPIHLVLKAEKSLLRLPKNFSKVNQEVERICRKNGIRLYKYANVGNHLHLLIKLSTRRKWARFIRELTGRIAQIFGGKTDAVNGFWKHRPFTRIVRGWRKAFRLAKEYVQLNILEAEGIIRRSEIRSLRELRKLWSETS